MDASAFELVVGLEVHAQLSSATKIFSPEAASFGDAPNSQVSLITLAHPGTLPRLNARVIELAVRMGIACNCDITRHTTFDRKNYFYPDLPKGYQITQDRNPVCRGGWVDLPDGSRVDLDRIHLEEDAGKSIHDDQTDGSSIDLNRAGTPLIEIVTRPCIHTAESAAAFLSEIRKIVRFLEVCDGNMEEGSLRADANVSVRPRGSTRLGKKVEIKNMNSVRNVRAAIESEFERQVGCLTEGVEIVSETRLFDVSSGRTIAMRQKEELNDYRYFPDPDLCAFTITDEWLADVRRRMTGTPASVAAELIARFGLPEYDAHVLAAERTTAGYVSEACKHTSQFKQVSNWVMGPVRAYLNDHPGADIPVAPRQLAELIEAIAAGTVSHTLAVREVFPEMINDPLRPLKVILSSLTAGAPSGKDELSAVIDEVIRIFPLKVEEYQNGKKGILAMFMGEVMKRTGGKADPKAASQLLSEKLTARKQQ